MKKIYITPAIELTVSHFENFICASPAGTQATWGGGDADHSNSDWDNEGYNDDSGTVPVPGDNGIIDAQAKGSIVFWDDEEEDELW